MPFSSWFTVCQRAEGQQHYRKAHSQKAASVIQLDHSFYKDHGESDNLKVLTLSNCHVYSVKNLHLGDFTRWDSCTSHQLTLGDARV